MLKNCIEEKFKIGVACCNSEQRLKISRLQEFLSDIGTAHSKQLGTGFYDLKDKGLIWVIAEMNIALTRIPTFEEEVTIKTWPLSPKNFTTNREFEMYDSNNKLIGYANSVWCVLDNITRRPVKIESIGSAEINFLNCKYPCEKFEFCDNKKMKLIGTDVVKLSDLDGNYHMNNTKYSQKVFDQLSQENYNKITPKFVHMKFMKECTLGTKLNVYEAEKDCNLYYEIRNTNANEVTFQMIVKQ